jgi:hypothetical protein
MARATRCGTVSILISCPANRSPEGSHPTQVILCSPVGRGADQICAALGKPSGVVPPVELTSPEYMEVASALTRPTGTVDPFWTFVDKVAAPNPLLKLRKVTPTASFGSTRTTFTRTFSTSTEPSSFGADHIVTFAVQNCEAHAHLDALVRATVDHQSPIINELSDKSSYAISHCSTCLFFSLSSSSITSAWKSRQSSAQGGV